MKEKKLFDAIGGISDKFVDEESIDIENKKKRRKRIYKKSAIIAAAVAVVLTGAVILPLSGIFGEKDGVVYPKALAFDDIDAKIKVREENPVSKETVNAVNTFGYKSAAKILKSGANGNYSPISLYYSLSLAASGAEGNTKSELLNALGISKNTNFSKENGNLYRNLYFENELGTLRIANSLWADNSALINKSFTENANKNFYASTHNVDLKGNSASRQISNWIRDNTKGTLAPKISTNKDTNLVILNTVYFNDQWVDEFKKENTHEGAFTKSNGSNVTAFFMNDKRDSGFYKGKNFSRASLPLRNGGDIVFVLPNEGTSVESLLASQESILNAFEGGEEETAITTWKIPKFKFNSDYDLNDSLKSLGINKAFQKDADFKGITNSNTFIDKVHQGSYISLNEKGVEASSYTEILMCGAAQITQHRDMFLTRPFLYGIYSQNGTLLFIGVVENPS